MQRRPGCLLQSAKGGTNRILLASAVSSMHIICPNRVSRHDWIIAVSLGCFVSLRTSSFQTNQYHLMPSSIRRHHWPCLPSGFGTCVEQPAVVCQECTVADDVPSRAEDCTFPVVVWQWLGDRDCTAQYNCCLPATTDCRRFCRFVCFSFLFNFARYPYNVFDVIVSP